MVLYLSNATSGTCNYGLDHFVEFTSSSELFELLNAGEMERSVQLIYQSWSGDTREK
jgi:hypothetical protein